MRGLSIAALVLSVIGAVNWGLVGMFNLNLVMLLFGRGILAQLTYIVVGFAGLYGVLMIARLASARDDVCVPGHQATGQA